jgi:hypothetical protein
LIILSILNIVLNMKLRATPGVLIAHNVRRDRWVRFRNRISAEAVAASAV